MVLSISGKPIPLIACKNWTVVGRFTFWSDSLFLSKWAVLGQCKLQCGSETLLFSQRSGDWSVSKRYEIVCVLCVWQVCVLWIVLYVLGEATVFLIHHSLCLTYSISKQAIYQTGETQYTPLPALHYIVSPCTCVNVCLHVYWSVLVR